MKEARNIVLTGFMGTGKTSVGKTLAEWVTFEFSDMDAIIEKEEGKTIPEIFAEKGEAQWQEAVEQINRNSAGMEAIFGYHEGTHRVTIKIVDKDTKEVKKEYPAEKTLDMIQKVWEMAGLMVDEKR